MHNPVFDDGLVGAIHIVRTAVLTSARRRSRLNNAAQPRMVRVPNGGLLNDCDAVTRIHCAVVVAVKNNGGNPARWMRSICRCYWRALERTTRSSSPLHCCEGRGHVVSGS